MRWWMKLLIPWCFLTGCFLGGSESSAGQLQDLNQTSTMDIELGEPLSSTLLDTLSGKQDMEIDNIDILLNNMSLDAQMENNSLISTATGINMVSSDSFSNSRGIATVIQNSGNQVVINNALILNLRIQ